MGDCAMTMPSSIWTQSNQTGFKFQSTPQGLASYSMDLISDSLASTLKPARRDIAKYNTFQTHVVNVTSVT